MVLVPRKYQVDRLGTRDVITKPDGTPETHFIQQWNLMQALVTQVARVSGVDIATVAPINGGGPIETFTAIGHDESGVVPGSYSSANITVDEFGHVTAAANGSGAIKGAMISRTTSQSITQLTDTRLPFTVEDYDDDGFVDLAASTTRITIPTGYNRAVLLMEVIWDSVVGDKFQQIWKNGVITFYAGQPNEGRPSAAQGSDRLTCSTGAIAVSPGDYFEANVFVSTAGRSVSRAAFSILAWNVA